MRLALRDQHQRGLVARVPERLPDLPGVEVRHGRIRHNADAADDSPGLHQLAHTGQEPLSQLDGVRALSQIDGYGLHSSC